MTEKELAKRILMLILPWPLSRLMPSGIRNAFTITPGSGATQYIGTGAPTPTPGAGAISETIFMPTPIAPQGILSDVIAWPSNTSPIQGPPSVIPPSPISGADETNVLDSTLWGDSENEDSNTFDDEAGTIEADGSFNLYPKDIIDDASEIDGLTIDFTESDPIGTVNIVQQNVDEPDPVNINNEVSDGTFPWDQFPDTNGSAQTELSFDHKCRVASVSFLLSRWQGDCTQHTYCCELWTSLRTGNNSDMVAKHRSSNIITGSNAWSETWVTFTFTPAAVLLANTTYAFLFRRIEAQDADRVYTYMSHTDQIQGFQCSTLIAGNHKACNIVLDMCIKFAETDLSDEVVLATFSNVTSGQKLPFTITYVKNMYVQFIDPSNEAAGVTVTGLIGNTYGFSTG